MGLTEHGKELLQCCTNINSRATAPCGASAMRQMFIEKPVDHCIVDLAKRYAPPRVPVNEVSDAPEVALHGLPSIATFGQVKNVRICVRCHCGLGEPLFAKQVARFDT